jgi:ketosteroid isomerase-like protein
MANEPTNVAIVRGGFDYFTTAGRLKADIIAPEFVWDMSHFDGWPEEQIYQGLEGAQSFIRDWAAAWDDWTLEVEAYLDAGEKVVVLVRQHGRSKAAGMPVEMYFAQVFSLRNGKQTSMEMYSDPHEAIRAVGLSD